MFSYSPVIWVKLKKNKNLLIFFSMSENMHRTNLFWEFLVSKEGAKTTTIQHLICYNFYMIYCNYIYDLIYYNYIYMICGPWYPWSDLMQLYLYDLWSLVSMIWSIATISIWSVVPGIHDLIYCNSISIWSVVPGIHVLFII